MVTEKSITERTSPAFGREVRFVHRSGRKSGRDAAVTRETFFIGRSGNNNLVLDDRSVSRKHAVLNFLDGRFILSDLNSFKGTSVNGRRVQEVELKNGDRVKIGSVVLEFQDGVPLARGPRKRWFILPLLFVTVGLAIMAAVFFSKPPKELDRETVREIEYNYSQGIKSYNVDRDIESARLYWERVNQMDPDGITAQGRKAVILLKNIISNAGDGADR